MLSLSEFTKCPQELLYSFKFTIYAVKIYMKTLFKPILENHKIVWKVLWIGELAVSDIVKATSENENDPLANWNNIERLEMSWEDSFLSEKIVHCASHRFLSLVGLTERGLCFCLKRGKNPGPSPAVWRLACLQDGGGEDKNWVENGCAKRASSTGNFAKVWLVNSWKLVFACLLVDFGWVWLACIKGY